MWTNDRSGQVKAADSRCSKPSLWTEMTAAGNRQLERGLLVWWPHPGNWMQLTNWSMSKSFAVFSGQLHCGKTKRSGVGTRVARCPWHCQRSPRLPLREFFLGERWAMMGPQSMGLPDLPAMSKSSLLFVAPFRSSQHRWGNLQRHRDLRPVRLVPRMDFSLSCKRGWV